MFGTDILRNKTMKILYFLNPLYTPAYPCFFFFEVFNCEFFISGTYFLFKLKDLRLMSSDDSAGKKTKKELYSLSH